MSRVYEQSIGRLFSDQFWLTLAKLAFLVGIGLFVLYMVALAQYPAVHEAFHDVRHAAGFPCH